MSIETIGLAAAARKLKDLPKQVRFATSQALNDTALQVQKFTIDKLLPGAFTLRGRGKRWFEPGNRFGFNVQFARKDRLISVVGSRADWLKDQESGGTKRASGGHRLAIPTGFWKKREEIMRRNKKPRQILLQKLNQDQQRAQSALSGAKTKSDKQGAKKELGRIKRARTALAGGFPAFVAKLKNGKVGIFARSSKKSLPIHLLFAINESARIPGRLKFAEKSKRVVEESYQAHFQRRLAAALLSAK